jgi:hypothetical protein
MSVEYIPQNTGLLTIENVKEGDKLVIIEDAYSQFSEKNQKTYWNAKVLLPDKTTKLAGLMEMSCDKFMEKWGKMTGDWTGHTVVVSIKQSNAGKDYIVLTPTDDPIVETVEEPVAPAVEPVKGVEYPKNEINPDDIPF